jgi:raffinose/stachyose/melibiose transport system substrate-binding protein
MMKRFLTLTLAALLVLSMLAVVPAGAEAKFQSRKIKILSIWDETDPSTNGYILNELSKEYAQTVEGVELDYEFVSIENLDQKVTTLMASDDLPEICIYESGVRLKKVIESGQILDLDKTLTDLGIRDCVDEGAASLLINLVDGVGLYDLPLGLNMEASGTTKRCSNRPVSPCHHLGRVPRRLPEAQGRRHRADRPGRQGQVAHDPRAQRLPGAPRGQGRRQERDGRHDQLDRPRLHRSRPDVPGYGHEGLLRRGMTTIDPGTATEMLTSGQAAMQYNGSWITQSLALDTNQAGPEGIGYFNVPLDNDQSTLDDYSMNCGNIMMFSAKKYDEAVGDWMKYVLPRIGDYSMQNFGTFKGYKINDMPTDLPTYTKIVGDALSSAKGAFLWFEAKMDSETSTLAQDNIALLYSGEMTPEEYMSQLQASTEKNRA